MPDMYVDVDAAVVVPVNVLPLLDDTDFKTRETAVAYNAAGMDLVWNFVTSAGVQTQTAVTPTTSGVYDWAHVGDAMYSIEMPASGGASINNDTEGYGWFSGIATGVLPWRGPVIGFRAAGLNDKLCDSAYSATRALAGTALPDAAAEAAGGLYTRGTGAGQINQAANGQVDVNLVSVIGTIVTAIDNGVYAKIKLSKSSGTYKAEATVYGPTGLIAGASLSSATFAIVQGNTNLNWGGAATLAATIHASGAVTASSATLTSPGNDTPFHIKLVVTYGGTPYTLGGGYDLPA